MARLGTNAKPAVVRVATEERALEIYALCEERGWKVVIGIEPDKEEDVSDINRLLSYKVENTKTVYNTNVVGRNDPYPCGSGKKYKNVVVRTF